MRSAKRQKHVSIKAGVRILQKGNDKTLRSELLCWVWKIKAINKDVRKQEMKIMGIIVSEGVVMAGSGVGGEWSGALVALSS